MQRTREAKIALINEMLNQMHQHDLVTAGTLTDDQKILIS